MSTSSFHTLILTATAVIGLGSVVLGTSAFDRLVLRNAPNVTVADPDAASAENSADIPRYIRRAPTRSPNDIWTFEFD